MAFGGVKATSDALGVPMTTVSYWHRKGIPAWRLQSVKDEATRRRIQIAGFNAFSSKA